MWGTVMKKTIHVPGFIIGTAENKEARTGVSVIIAKDGAAAGVEVRGCAPGTRETDLLRPEKTVDAIHAVVLAGGSAFGLEAACGVMDYLEEKGIGFDVGVAKVPIVCSAVLFDLAVGDPSVRPDKAMGRQAAEKAGLTIETGSTGAGCGATVGKLKGFDRAMNSGAGYAETVLESGLAVGAYVCVNACGEVYEGERVLAGVRGEDGRSIVSSHELMMNGYERILGGNTTIGCILTNAKLTKAQCRLVCGTAHNGYALAIRPVHTSMDGDTVFTMASGQIEVPVDTVGYLAQEMMRQAIVNAVKSVQETEG